MPHSTYKRHNLSRQDEEDYILTKKKVGKDIGDIIAKRRLEKGITQGDLADSIGVSEQTISNWENARVSMSWLQRSHTLCIALDVSLSDLFPVEKSEKNASLLKKLISDMKSGMGLSPQQEHLKKRLYITDKHPGSRIKEKRESLDMSQRDLARLIKVSEGTIACWESKAIAMKWLERAYLLCERLDLKLEDLYPNTDLVSSRQEKDEKSEQDFNRLVEEVLAVERAQTEGKDSEI